MILTDLGIGQAGVYALLGYAVVFLGLVLLMILVMIIGKVFITIEKRKIAKVVPVEPPVEVIAPPAPGSAGALKLYNVDPKTAAMLMAIVADKLQRPINELRFISIKEVEQ